MYINLNLMLFTRCSFLNIEGKSFVDLSIAGMCY